MSDQWVSPRGPDDDQLRLECGVFGVAGRNPELDCATRAPSLSACRRCSPSRQRQRPSLPRGLQPLGREELQVSAGRRDRSGPGVGGVSAGPSGCSRTTTKMKTPRKIRELEHAEAETWSTASRCRRQPPGEARYGGNTTATAAFAAHSGGAAPPRRAPGGCRPPGPGQHGHRLSRRAESGSRGRHGQVQSRPRLRRFHRQSLSPIPSRRRRRVAGPG